MKGNKAEKDVMKKIDLGIPDADLIKAYDELKSCYKVADKFGTKSYLVKRALRNLGVLRSQKQAAKERVNKNFLGKKHTEENKKKLSEYAKKRPVWFKGKTHSKEVKELLSQKAKQRVGEKNPNYKHGDYRRRPRDFKQHEFTSVRNFVFNRDKYTCKFTGQVGGHLHAHHLIPFWIKEEAFLDPENLITVSTKTHFEFCHNNNWCTFNVDIIPDSLLEKYDLCRERLNELALNFTSKLKKKKTK